MQRKGTAILMGVLVAALAFPVMVNAEVVAYWRHEEGPVGADVNTSGVFPDNVLDSSGNANHMRTFDGGTAATYVATVSPVPLRSGLPNTLALDFDLDEDGDGPDLNDDNYTDLMLIDGYLWDEMTVEFAFNLEVNGLFQALVGKDGKPLVDSALAPFAAKVRGDGFPNNIPSQLQVEWLDGDGDAHFLASGFTMQPGTWYQVAFVLTDTDAELYVSSGGGDYVLVDSITEEDFAGALGEVIYDSIAPFTVGRGQYNGGNADWADAIIDEVRYSDTALLPSEFLFDPSLVGDDDNDGVSNGDDVCPNTPEGAAVDAEGRPLGDLDMDCDTDLADYAIMQQGFTGPLE